MKILKQEVREVLEYNILRFWIDRMQDDEHGGFYGRIDNNNVLNTDADKGAILNARILWTFSAAYRVLRKPVYLEMANRAKRYFIDHFIDPKYGGVYWSLDYKGVQAEAVVGFINIFQHFHDESAFKKALCCWQYIKDKMIDYKNGEWYWSRHRDRTLNTTDDKAGFWKCPYHNGRMCLEIIERKI